MRFLTGLCVGCILSYIVVQYKVVSYNKGEMRVNTNRIQNVIKSKIK